jgi:hypothetical protein
MAGDGPWPSYVPPLLIFGGRPAAVAICGALMTVVGDDRHSSDIPFLLCLFAGSALPLVGGLMLVHLHIAARIVVAVLSALIGLLLSFCGGFIAWLLAGAPGFRMD